MAKKVVHGQTKSPASKSPPESIEDLGAITLITSDRVFNQAELSEFDRWTVQSLKDRDAIYSTVLRCYQDYAKNVLEKNPGRQTLFFWASIIILMLSPLQFFVCLFLFRGDANLIPILASVAEALGALLVFPKIIAEYLFNTNETTSINSIVAAIQDYDISIRSGIRHTVENHSGEHAGSDV